MATSKPLTLRKQRAKASSRTKSGATSTLQAEVLVDTGVYHLNEPYSYFLQDYLRESVEVGSVVKVPFASSNKTGVVLSIGPVTSAGLKSIEETISPHAVQESLLLLAKEMNKETFCHRFDLYKPLLPASSKREIPSSDRLDRSLQMGTYSAHYVPVAIGESSFVLLCERLRKDPDKKRLIILPTAREVQRLSALTHEIEIASVEYGSHLSLSMRKRNSQEIVEGRVANVLGTRSAIFAPMNPIEEIIVVDDWSEHFFEQRTPFWNLREVAFSRAKIEGSALFFLSSSTSIELAQQIRKGQVHQVRQLRLPALTRPRVRCSPHSYLELARKALRDGPVLITVAEKNFSSLFLCGKCRSIAKCECGGRIIMPARDVFVCSLCSSSYSQWRCRECDSSAYVMLKSGIERTMEEIRKSISNTPISLSIAGKEIERIEDEKRIVISTSGMEPIAPEGYAAIILLNGEELASRPFVRAEEELLQRWFKTLQLLKKSGEIFLSLPNQHRISQAIIAGSPFKYLDSELKEREELGLPPSKQVMKIESKSENLSALRKNLQGKFPDSSIHLSSNSRGITFIIDDKEVHEAIHSIRALQKVRSMQSKELLRISLNPYFF